MFYRTLTIQDYPAYDTLRGMALDTVPEAFGSTNEEENSLRKNRFESNVTHLESFIMGAFDGEELVGMVGFLKFEKIKLQHRGMIWGMFVKQEMQGRGIGAELMKNALKKAAQIKHLKKINLDVNAENPAAIHLYRKMGFIDFGVDKNALLVAGKMYDTIMMSKIVTSS